MFLRIDKGAVDLFLTLQRLEAAIKRNEKKWQVKTIVTASQERQALLRNLGRYLLDLFEKQNPSGKHHKCKWTEITPEYTEDGYAGNAEMWKWCIQCGNLKLGKAIYSPGPHQKMVIVEDT